MDRSDELSIRGYRHHASAMPLPARRPVRAGGSRARAAGHYHTSVPWCARKRSFASIVPCQSSHCAMPCGSSPATRRNFPSSPFLRRYVARSGVILERIVETVDRAPKPIAGTLAGVRVATNEDGIQDALRRAGGAIPRATGAGKHNTNTSRNLDEKAAWRC
jgi:hypothetical protein